MPNAAIFAAGIFAHEVGQRLLQILLKLGDRGFKGLYARCNGIKNGVNGVYYQTGLKRVSSWSQDVINEDIAFVRESCPDMDETFVECFGKYVVDRFGQNKRVCHKCPPIDSFVRIFLESLGQHEALITGAFFDSRDQAIKRIACMDTCRQALYTLVSMDNVRVELESEVGSITQHKKLSDSIYPDDSISQIGSNFIRINEVTATESTDTVQLEPYKKNDNNSVVSRHIFAEEKDITPLVSYSERVEGPRSHVSERVEGPRSHVSERVEDAYNRVEMPRAPQRKEGHGSHVSERVEDAHNRVEMPRAPQRKEGHGSHVSERRNENREYEGVEAHRVSGRKNENREYEEVEAIRVSERRIENREYEGVKTPRVSERREDAHNRVEMPRVSERKEGPSSQVSSSRNSRVAIGIRQGRSPT